jgi:hypothetical protein
VRSHAPARFQLKGRVSIFSQNLSKIRRQGGIKMAESIVKVPRNKNVDYDFIAFSFNGKHSYEDFGIYRIIDGSRYIENLSPKTKDLTAEASGDGTYYFGSHHKERVFNINFAFDRLSDLKIRELKKWLDGKV